MPFCIITICIKDLNGQSLGLVMNVKKVLQIKLAGSIYNQYKIKCDTKVINSFKNELINVRILITKLISHVNAASKSNCEIKIISEAIEKLDYRTIHEINKYLAILGSSNDDLDTKLININNIRDLKDLRAEMVYLYRDLEYAIVAWNMTKFKDITTTIIFALDDFIARF